jgi:hypothetical protein
VARLQSGFLVIFFCCVFGSVSFAQDEPAPAGADLPAGAPAKPHVKKSPRKKASADRLTVAPASQSASEEAEKAARLAEGRKKFFEQSSGFENEGSDRPISLGNGGAPSVGFKF